MNSTNFDSNQSPFPTEVAPNQTGVQFQAIRLGTEESDLIRQLSPAFLAYIGDAVYELYVRTHYLLPPRRLADYHNQVVSQVRAETQASLLQRLIPNLTEAEQEIVRRGRNAASGCPRRLSPSIYQQATSLETLIGYLYLHDPQRLNQLLESLSQYS